MFDLNEALSFQEVDTLKAQSSELKEKIKRWQQKSQKLSIGIIGQVKAGKSSFLNALLFDGKPILPEAATPKTANLTKISYGEQFLLSIDYYTKNEWEAIKERAQLASDSTEVKIAKELVEMAGHLSEHERQRCLENGREEIRKADLNGLQAILNQYTGNNGSHTPLVKSTQIQLPFDDLKGFEVVDTPGMNDPVASRTNKTREYMANCDVVFFLSRCSQFLDKSDDDLLKNHLPNKGVKRLVVVAGQFDSAILDDGYDRSSLQETINNLTTRQTRQALQKSEQMVASKVSLSPSQANMVQESLSQPIFSSSFAYGFANWPQSRWSKSMKHMYKELTEMANEEWGQVFSQQDWQQIANFSALLQAFDQAKKDKEVLLAQQKKEYLPDAYQAMINTHQQLQASIKQHIDIIGKKVVDDIEAEKSHFEKRLNKITKTLKEVIDSVVIDANQKGNELLSELNKEKKYSAKLVVRKGSAQEDYSYTVSTSKWYNPFSWGSRATRHRTRTVTYDYINPHDAIERIESYRKDSVQKIENEFGRLINPNNIKSNLKQALLAEDIINTSSDSFDVNMFKRIIDNFIDKLVMPTLHFEQTDMSHDVGRQFSGEVTDQSKMDALRAQTQQALALIFEKIESEFQDAFKKMVEKLKAAGEDLEASLTEEINTELDKIKADIKNKERKIDEHRHFLEQVKTSQTEIESKLSLAKEQSLQVNPASVF